MGSFVLFALHQHNSVRRRTVGSGASPSLGAGGTESNAGLVVRITEKKRGSAGALVVARSKESFIRTERWRYRILAAGGLLLSSALQRRGSSAYGRSPGAV